MKDASPRIFLDDVKRYALAFAIVAVGIVLRGLLIPVVGEEHFPFITLFGAVVFCSWYCGIGPSIVSTLAGLVYVWYAFLPPVHSFQLADPKMEGGGVAIFAAVAGLVIALGESNRSTRRLARTAADRWQLAQQAAGIGSFEWNIKTDVNRWTPELEAMYGLKQGEFRGTLAAWEKLVHPEDLAEAKRRLGMALQEGAFDAEWRVVWPDGSVHWLLARGFVFKDRAGKPDHMLGVNIDVSERRLAEDARGHLAAIVDSSDDAIVSKTMEGIITSWNKSAERLFGFDAAEAVGRHVSLIIPGNRLDEETKIIEQLKRGQRVDHFETVRRRKDGTFIDVSLTISPVKDVAGRITGASKVARDITERKKAELDRQRFITLADRCTEFIGMCDMEYQPFYANDAALRLIGLESLEELRSARVADFFFPEDRDFIANEFFPRVLREGRGETEIRFRHFKTGATVWMIYNVFVIKDSAGKPIALGTFSQNITRRKADEDALRRSEERLRALSENLEKEVGSRTAELEQRNIEILQQAEELRELSMRLLKAQDLERRRIARDLHDSAGQLLAALAMTLAGFSGRAGEDTAFADTLNETQDLVRQISNEIRTTSYLLHPPLLDENGLPQAIRWYMQGLRERSGLEIELLVSEQFGRLPADLELALFRILQECLTNVHRHSGSKTATIRLMRNVDSVSMQIQDHGKGIPPERLAAVRAHRGGVGMTGMRERVRQLDGRIDIQSNPGGTTVAVTLPIQPPSAIETADTTETPRAG